MREGVGFEDFSVCHRAGEDVLFARQGCSARHPCCSCVSASAPGCSGSSQIYLSISPSQLFTGSAISSRFKALQVSIFSILLQQALAWGWHFHVPDPWQWRCVASLARMAARESEWICSGNDPYSWKTPTIWGSTHLNDLPHSPSCCCSGAQGGLDGANGLVNYSPLFIKREFVEGLRQSIYISWRKRNWKH